MPDPEGLTLSATQTPALFDASPYFTKWMLWQHFANGMDLSVEADNRMEWGKKMQPLVLAEAAEKMRMEVVPNEETYQRRGRLGCTRDAKIVCPDRGPGALETKCVFDYRIWMEKWAGGDRVPQEIEIQLQQQMYVGDPFHGEYRWGLLAVWVGADIYYFEREPNVSMWRSLETEADRFFDDVAQLREPPVFGSVMELPWLLALHPTQEGKVLDLREEDGAEVYVTKAAKFLASRELAKTHGKLVEGYRAEFLGLAKGAEKVLLPGGGNITVGKRNVVQAWLPGVADE